MSRYRATMKDLLEKVYKEDGHQDVSSSKRMCRTIREDAQQIETKLNTMSPEDSLDTWWTNKLAVSANNLNKARDYIVNDVKEELEEATVVSDISGISIPALKRETAKFNIKVARVTPGGPMGAEYEVTFTGREQDLIRYAKEHFGFDDKPGTFKQLKKHLAMEEVELEEKFALYALKDFIDRRAPGGRRKKGDRVSGPMTYTQALSKAKQMNVGSSLPGGDKRVEVKPMPSPWVMEEEVELDEGKMKTIATMFDQGKSAEEIAKALKLPTSTVKSILGEETELDEFTLSQINTLKKSYADMKGKTISPEKANALSKHLDKLDLLSLRQLNKEKIPFISTLARNKIYRKTGKFEEVDLEESAAAAEIQRTNTRRDSMDYGMYKKAVELLRTKQYAKLGKHIYDAETAPREYVMGVIDKKEPSTFKKIFGNQTGYYSLMKPKLKEELEEQTMRQKAVMIAKKMAGNMTDAVKEIEKLMKGLSKDPVVATTLKRVNEDYLKETDITKDNVQKGDTDKEKELKIKLDKEKDQDTLEKQLIAAQGQINILKQKLENEKNKALKPEPNRETGEVPLTVGVAYKHFKDKAKKEQVNEARFEVEGRVDYKGVSGGDDFSIVVDAPNAKAAEKKVEDMLFKHRDQRKIGPRGGRGVDDYEIESVERTSKSVTNKFFTYHAAEKDPSINEATKNTDFKVKMKTPSGMKMVRVTVPIKDFVVDMAKIEDAARRKVKGDMVNFDFVGDIKMEADLTKSQIKKVHDKADELPKDSFRDRYGKKQGDSVRYAVATNMVKKKLGIKEDRRLYVETIAGLKKKAEKSGMPYSILKKVYDRGMAAWKGGHRPGATQQQWAFARVNSFVTKSSGTWGGADKDLAAKVRGSK